MAPTTINSTSCSDKIADLPLVLFSPGETRYEFESVYDHLEEIRKTGSSAYQSLIVTRPEMSDVLFRILRSKAESLPHVHIRRLDDDVQTCSQIPHRSGSFFAPPRQVAAAR